MLILFMDIYGSIMSFFSVYEDIICTGIPMKYPTPILNYIQLVYD